MTHLIALDLDGTLEDSRDDMVAAACKVRADFGVPARAAEVIRPHVNAGMDHLYRAVFDDVFAHGVTLPEIRAAYEVRYMSHIADATRLYPGIADALVELSRMGRLACVTNKPEHLSVALLAALGVGHLFAAVIGGDTCVVAKPSPVVLGEASRRVGRTGGAVMIGDSPADVRCGRSFGAATIWCAWGYAAEPGELAPDRVAREPAALPALVRELVGA